jgi:hypothetical protein
MSFDLAHFWRFCSQISINTKELGTIRMDNPFGTQRWVMRQIAKGLDEGVHNFTVLKCRQIGLSTVSLALDLYWVFQHPGLDATIITHDDEAQGAFRTQLEEYYRQLPKAWKPKKVAHNRNEFVFRAKGNSISRIQYQVAGTRKKGGALGRSKGNAYAHATEMSSWGDQEGLMSLRASLAEQNPNRLYLWESTARGFNGFYDIWKESQNAVTQRGIFVSWWAHELYRIPKGDRRYEVYWGVDGKMTRDEREATREVALTYGDAMEYVNGTKEISPEQWAWYRWYGAERVGDEELLPQEMPHTALQAFIVSGTQFFKGKDLADAYRRIDKEPYPQPLRVEVRHTMLETHVLSVPRKVANLLIWAPPVAGAVYVLGADPAYGSSEWADRFCISVWRAYADRVEQVAEFADPGFMPYSFAWVLCYLAGCYAPCYWNLEVNGPGGAVLQEIDHLRKMSWTTTPAVGAPKTGELGDSARLRNFFGGMKEFLWKRTDQISGAPSARGTKSNFQEKQEYMDTYQDYFHRGIVVPHSRELIDEMKGITREEGQAPAASGRAKDDRVIAAALAARMWQKRMAIDLMRRGITYQKTEAQPNKPVSVLDSMVHRRMELLGMNQKRPS